MIYLLESELLGPIGERRCWHNFSSCLSIEFKTVGRDGGWRLLNSTCTDYPISTDDKSTIRAVATTNPSVWHSRDRERVGIQHHDPKNDMS